MTTLTATTAAEQLLADVRHMLARHDGAESLDELRELADELSTALRRVRGRISRLAKKEEPDAPTNVAPSAPTSNEPAPNVAPPPAEPPKPAAEPRAAAPPPPRLAEPPPAQLVALRRARPRWYRAVLIVAVIAAVLLGVLLLVGARSAEQAGDDRPGVIALGGDLPQRVDRLGVHLDVARVAGDDLGVLDLDAHLVVEDGPAGHQRERQARVERDDPESNRAGADQSVEPVVLGGHHLGRRDR